MENLPKKIHTFTNLTFFRNLRSLKKIELEIEFRLLHLKGSFESVLSKQIKVLRMSNEEDHQNRPNPKKRENKVTII